MTGFHEGRSEGMNMDDERGNPTSCGEGTGSVADTKPGPGTTPPGTTPASVTETSRTGTPEAYASGTDAPHPPSPAVGRTPPFRFRLHQDDHHKDDPSVRWHGTWVPVDVDIVVPVYNEHEELACSVEKIIGWLTSVQRRDRIPVSYTWRITIADNASTDDTWEIARNLCDGHPTCVRAMHIDFQGRGLALRLAWASSEARVSAYMDIDLSTDIHGFDDLVRPLLDDTADLAIGSRLLPDSQVVRCRRREFVSRVYNALLRSLLRFRVHDAQCGFKALTHHAVTVLLPLVQDRGWFFDSEILALAQQLGLRTQEIAVRWVEDRGSTVRVIDTAVKDLRGIRRMRRELTAMSGADSPRSVRGESFDRNEEHGLHLAGSLMPIASDAGKRPSDSEGTISTPMHDPQSHRTSRLYRTSRLSWPQRASMTVMLAFAAMIFLTNLTVSGWANQFYSAAAMAGSRNWTAFLFGSVDPANAITVDKPPASLWIVALSVRLLGLRPLSILLPQALMGIISTYLLYALMRRYWGHTAGIITGTTFMLTPVVALIFRYNNPDALLVLISVAVTSCVLRSLEYDSSRSGNRRRTGWMASAGVLLGLGFLTKQLQILLIVPGLAAAFLIASPSRFMRRLADGLIAILSACAAAGWWVLLTILIPSNLRPYIGGSQHDSFLELTFGYNGFGRLTGAETGAVASGETQVWGQTGLDRLLTGDFATQVCWLIVPAFAGIVLGVMATRQASRLSIRRATVIVFALWLVMTWLVFSFMKGIFHEYYTVALAPAVSVLASIATVVLIVRAGTSLSRIMTPVLVLGNALCVTGIIVSNGFLPRLIPLILVCGITGSVIIVLLNHVPPGQKVRRGGSAVLRSSGRAAAVILTTVSLLAAPTAWTAWTMATPSNGFRVIAGPTSNLSLWATRHRWAEVNGTRQSVTDWFTDPTIVDRLKNSDVHARWAMAVSGSQTAALYQLASGRAVMAVGGYNGTDPFPTLKRFVSLTRRGDIRYYLDSVQNDEETGASTSSNGDSGLQFGGSVESRRISVWVRHHYRAQVIDDLVLYDLSAPLSGKSAAK